MRLTLYEMPAVTVPTGLSGAQVVGSFVGEIIDAELDLKQIVLEVGSALDAVTGDIPGRRLLLALWGGCLSYEIRVSAERFTGD